LPGSPGDYETTAKGLAATLANGRFAEQKLRVLTICSFAAKK
jgi:hypothetical protein